MRIQRFRISEDSEISEENDVFPQLGSPPDPRVTGGDHILPKGTGDKGVLLVVKMIEGHYVHCKMAHES